MKTKTIKIKKGETYEHINADTISLGSALFKKVRVVDVVKDGDRKLVVYATVHGDCVYRYDACEYKHFSNCVSWATKQKNMIALYEENKEVYAEFVKIISKMYSKTKTPIDIRGAKVSAEIEKRIMTETDGNAIVSWKRETKRVVEIVPFRYNGVAYFQFFVETKGCKATCIRVGKCSYLQDRTACDVFGQRHECYNEDINKIAHYVVETYGAKK